MTPRRVPERMCALCRARAPKRELVRVVWDGTAVSLDPSGKTAGRGAYVGTWRSCWADPGLVPKLERALKAKFGAADAARLRARALELEEDDVACPRRAALTTRAER